MTAATKDRAVCMKPKLYKHAILGGEWQWQHLHAALRKLCSILVKDIPEHKDCLAPVRLRCVWGGGQLHRMLLAEARAEVGVKPQHKGMALLRPRAGLQIHTQHFHTQI